MKHFDHFSPLTHLVCTPCYRAPEVVMSRGGYTSALDMWSLGCIFAELLQRTVYPGSATTPQLRVKISQSFFSEYKYKYKKRLDHCFVENLIILHQKKVNSLPWAMKILQLEKNCSVYLMSLVHHHGHVLRLCNPKNGDLI